MLSEPSTQQSLFQTKELKNKKSTRNHSVVSLFSGCGGMDLGFESEFDVFADSVNENLHSD